MIITIDGLSASGKFTLAKALAVHLNIRYIDTGKMYRYAALMLSNYGINPHKTPLKAVEIIKDMDYFNINKYLQKLSSEEIGNSASQIASLKEIRQALLLKQRSLALAGNGAILDGRDAGTAICPDADHKFYVKASVNVRARRRYKELQTKNNSVMYAVVLKSVIKRDLRDKVRSHNPSVVPLGAVVIDTSFMSSAEVFELALSCIQ